MATLLNTDPMGLNELAKGYQTLYPIAARCGVFAKTDVQPLINEGAAKEDIAASIFQSVVNQTISGLACGRPIRGNVAFLGGPLHYLTELRQRFIETLKLQGEAIIHPENSHLFVALGSALMAEGREFQISDLPSMLENAGDGEHETRRYRGLCSKIRRNLTPCSKRHAQRNAERSELKARGRRMLFRPRRRQYDDQSGIDR